MPFDLEVIYTFQASISLAQIYLVVQKFFSSLTALKNCLG